MFIFCGTASAATVNVTPGSHTLEDAISNANSGDTLSLQKGTYNGHDLQIDKNLTITGPRTTGKPTAIIDALQNGRAFNIISGSELTLKYVLIQNGDASEDTDSVNGGAIQNKGTLTIINSQITKNTATYAGGGIYNEGTCNVIGSIINSNTANEYGGGIWNNNICTVNGSTITNNIANNKYGGGIYSSGTCTVTDSIINRNTATFDGGGISNYGNCTVNGTIISSNTATLGGGIFNRYGTCSVTGSTLQSNSAADGGGIYNEQCTCTVSASTINSNTATYAGGGICNFSNCSVTGSTINSNTASDGGGINNGGYCYVTGSTLQGNTASDGGAIQDDRGYVLDVSGCDFAYNVAKNNGNAIYTFNYEDDSFSNRIVQCCRFYDPAIGYENGYEIYAKGGSVDAMFNWWGSNNNPSSKVYGSVDTSPWLILTISADHTLTGKDLTSVITTDITHDSTGMQHRFNNGPNRIPVTLATTLGSISSPIYLANGVAEATLNAGSISGTAYISALLDDEIALTEINIDATPPKIISTYPTHRKTGFSRTGTIKIKFRENIYTSTDYGKITVKNLTTGKTTPITKSISGNTLYITNKRSAYTWYAVTIPAAAVKDKAGNKFATEYTFIFKTGA